MLDIYFERAYGKIYEKLENGTAEVFDFKSENGRIHHLFMKRKLPIENSPVTLYDLVTPYGYGGPVIREYKQGQKQQLMNEFEQSFTAYCEENNIISEFVRFHPIIGNAADFQSLYDVSYIRNTVGTNLKDYDDPFTAEFSKSCRKNVRKALNKGVTYRITEKPAHLGRFKEIYYATMERNQAADYYYFDDAYFEQCLANFRENIITVEAIYEDETIAMGFYFVYNNMIHIHLSGTRTDFLHLSPAYILRYAVTKWGKENGYELIHHGGGRSNDPEDGLYRFKKQFGTQTDFPFFIGNKIWHPAIYNKLVTDNEINADTGFFPAYREKSTLVWKDA